MTVIMFNVTLLCTIVIAFSLYVIESSGGLNFEINIAILDVCTLIALPFAYFYFSERITTNVSSIGDVFYHSPWYNRLTAKQQKLLVLALQRSQREVRLTGIGLFDCSLPMFSAVRIAP